MEAKDTVMTTAKYNQISKAWHIEKDISELYIEIDFLNAHQIAMLQAQAEISFKAGYEQLKNEYDKDMKQHRLAGIREVVEWVNSRNIISNTETRHGQEWQVQLKKWGMFQSLFDNKAK